MNHFSGDSTNLELWSLLAARCDGTMTPRMWNRLNQLLHDDPAARITYVLYMDQHATLLWRYRDGFANDASDKSIAASIPLSGFLGNAIHGTVGYFSQGVPLWCVIAVVLVSIGAMVASLNAPPHAPQAVARRDIVVVGKISGIVGCKWTSDGIPGGMKDDILLNRQFKLEAGLMEITYATGAKVILEGPVTYVVESTNGGYLSLGKLTGKVATQAAKGFSVRTPTAIVTDLGTEFGVKVSGAGATETQVLQGAVELRVLGANGRQPPQVLLPDHGLTCVTVGENHVVTVRREMAKPDAFVRQLAGWQQVPIKLFNTGVNVAEGQPDPHWQIIARSDDPKFRAQSALVSRAPTVWLANVPSRSQWISLAADASTHFPADAAFTFRTSFELLTGAMLDSARVTGQFTVDNHVRAIRLNGREMLVPEHGYESFDVFHRFAITQGFVAGTNVLEIDVENAVPNGDASMTAMGLRVELEGSVSAWVPPLASMHDSQQE